MLIITSPHYNKQVPSAQADEVAKELKKPEPDPMSPYLEDWKRLMQSSFKAAVTEWETRKGQDKTP